MSFFGYLAFPSSSLLSFFFGSIFVMYSLKINILGHSFIKIFILADEFIISGAPKHPFFENKYFQRKLIMVGLYKVWNRNNLRVKFLQNLKENLKRFLFLKSYIKNSPKKLTIWEPC